MLTETPPGWAPLGHQAVGAALDLAEPEAPPGLWQPCPSAGM